MAKNAPKPHKAAYLIKASSQLEISVLKLRLFLELKIANETKIFQAQHRMAEIGRMLGGWIKSLNNL
ncbi:four helix bundle protein [Candidatus Uhrbacteria bacterium]|nr:four helix bundle protein [Candidatus Uhrbacteria bacterium]